MAKFKIAGQALYFCCYANYAMVPSGFDVIYMSTTVHNINISYYYNLHVYRFLRNYIMKFGKNCKIYKFTDRHRSSVAM